LGGEGEWKDPIPSPSPFRYRAKTFLLPQRRGERLVLGARPPRGAELVDTSGCAVLRPELEALATRARAILSRRLDEEGHLRTVLLRCNRAGQTQLTLAHRDDAEWLEEAAVAIGADAAFLQRHDLPGNRIHSDNEEVQVFGDGPVVERFPGPVEALVPPTAFFQGNPDVAERLYSEAAAALEGEHLAELYCGSGVAGLTALRLRPGSTLLGVDRAPRAIATARANARRNGLEDRCRLDTAAAEECGFEAESVLVNPPRSGCHEAVLDAVVRSGARVLVYLSCNASSLARDIGRLGWPVGSITPADMFPQTPHLELLAVLRRP
jgi:tRNA/tmRNA/rRNA uracil-C5-methylase (TrmA/RlmC/RlmD family)